MINIKYFLKNCILYFVLFILAAALYLSVRFPLNNPEQLSIASFLFHSLPYAAVIASAVFIPVFYSKNNEMLFLKLLLSTLLIPVIMLLFSYQPVFGSISEEKLESGPAENRFYISGESILFNINSDRSFIHKAIVIDKTENSSDYSYRNKITVLNNIRYMMRDNQKFTIPHSVSPYTGVKTERFSAFFNTFLKHSEQVSNDISMARLRNLPESIIKAVIFALTITLLSLYFSKSRQPIINYLLSQTALIFFLFANYHLQRIDSGSIFEKYIFISMPYMIYLAVSVILLINILFSRLRKEAG